MFELGGEESEYWSDDLNCRYYDLERSLDDDNYDGWGYDRNGYFYQLEKTDDRIKGCDHQVEYFLLRLETLKTESKGPKKRKLNYKNVGKKMIVDFDMDYKTIEKDYQKNFLNLSKILQISPLRIA